MPEVGHDLSQCGPQILGYTFHFPTDGVGRICIALMTVFPLLSAVIKHLTKNNLEKEGFTSAYRSQSESTIKGTGQEPGGWC